MTARASEPEAWFEKAEHNLLAILKLMVGDNVPWDMVAFHAQQAAEKCLKGFLVHCGATVPRVHDLVSLLRDCRRYDDTLETMREDCERLTRLGWASRYPDAPEEIDESMARQAVELAQRVESAIRQRVPRGEAPE